MIVYSRYPFVSLSYYSHYDLAMREQGLQLQEASVDEFFHLLLSVLNSQNLNHGELDPPRSLDKSQQKHIWPTLTSNEDDVLPTTCSHATCAEQPGAFLTRAFLSACFRSSATTRDHATRRQKESSAS